MDDSGAMFDIKLSFLGLQLYPHNGMAQLIVRDLDNDIKAALQQRARQHGWSMEEEVRQILRRSVDQTPAVPAKLGSRIAARFKDVCLDAPIPESRGQTVEPVAFPG